MKQVLQNLGNGETELAVVPAPMVGSGHLLIRTSKSLVSVGTERMLVEFGKAGLIGKARQQPDKVRMVLDKVRTDGLAPTIDTVRNKLDEPLPLGYCNVGKVIEAGGGVTGFAVGDRVASNGKHAEIVNVPTNLCAKIPDNVDDESASFTVIGAIALQGIRLIKPTMGETIVVTGLGLIGLMAVQLLRAQGCRVLGIDFDAAKLKLAKQLGAEIIDLSGGVDPVQAAMAFTKDRGVDAVLITASAKSSDPMHQAANMCRQRGRIVLVGVVGLELSRADFFEKELTFQVSCSYGPGRYDTNYEEKGQDYPYGLVRWTEQRNFEAVLELMASGSIDMKPLISHRFSIDKASDAYKIVGGAEPSLGILLEYESPDSQNDDPISRIIQLGDGSARGGSKARTAFIGSGNYAKAVLIPAFKTANAYLASVVSGGGVSAVHAAKKFKFNRAMTDATEVLEDPDIDAVAITTRHNSHAGFVLAAIEANKHVFVEKPLCLTLDELAKIETAYASKSDKALLLMVGFNRRFAPQVKKIKSLIAAQTTPKSFIMTVNAGAIPTDHWTQDPLVGGGRIIGEACHFIDLLRHLAGAPITHHSILAMDTPSGDNVVINLGFEDGSIGTIQYLANGNKGFPKERLEVFCAGKVLQLDNFRMLKGWGWKGFSKLKLWRQDKGQSACAKAFVDAIKEGGEVPIPVGEVFEVSRTTIEIALSLDV
ncbi:MAG: bi-domain-containing oxidoreductase [Rhizobiaceae bacterium]